MKRPTARGDGPGIATRLLLAQGLVVICGALTAAGVAAIVGPPLFHHHLLMAGEKPNTPELTHIERAYTSANAIALATAVLIALIAAIAVTWYLSRRLTRPVVRLAAVAERLSDGDYTVRATPAAAGPELASLTATFNQVAERLQHIEATRHRLLTDLAHELRNPIATIEAYLDGLDDGITEWGDEPARVLRDQTTRLHRLAEDLNDVSRAEEGELGVILERTTIRLVTQAAIESLRPKYAAEGVHLRCVPDGGSTAQAFLDPQRLGQALTNVLINALRHTPPGGVVTVETTTDAHSIRLTVTDTGDGIPAELLPHIFERFYRGNLARDRDRTGSGIGLTISRAIVHAHHGTLTADSHGPGHGTRFTFTLPRNPTRTPGDREPSASSRTS